MVPKALLDTNIFLEILFEQRYRQECLALLKMLQEGRGEAYVTNFTFFSIGIIAFRKHIEPEKVRLFFDLVAGISGLHIFDVAAKNIPQAYIFAREQKLDFEDAIQYFSARHMSIPIVTFDQDFFNTDLEVLNPKEYLRE